MSKKRNKLKLNGNYSPSALSEPGIPFTGIPNEYQIIVGPNIKTIEDKRSKTRVANFPFEFPNGTRGILIVCRVKDENWKPSNDIKSLNIEFK